MSPVQWPLPEQALPLEAAEQIRTASSEAPFSHDEFIRLRPETSPRLENS